MSEPIVLQLQRDAANETTGVSALLRTALMVATKLGVDDFSSWATNELSGYPSDGEGVPEYRVLSSRLEADNPINGAIPVLVANSELSRKLQRQVVFQSIPELEELLARDARGKLASALPADICQRICRDAGVGTTLQIYRVVDRAAMVGILNRVRDVVLHWALELERQDVLGEGLLFSSAERAAAQGQPSMVNHFHGPALNPQIQQGGDHLTQSSGDVRVSDLSSFVNNVTQAVPGLGLSGGREAELLAELETLRSQAGSPSPKPVIVQEGLRSVRTILEGAAGSQTATLLAELTSLLPF